MIHQSDSFANAKPDAATTRAMRAELKSFRALANAPSPTEHPLRAEMLVILADARTRIDRINQPAS